MGARHGASSLDALLTKGWLTTHIGASGEADASAGQAAAAAAMKANAMRDREFTLPTTSQICERRRKDRIAGTPLYT
jgi:hypothetical protein